MLEIISSLDTMQLVVLIIGAMLIGINKTAIPGLGVLPVVMLTHEAKTSNLEAALAEIAQSGVIGEAPVKLRMI